MVAKASLEREYTAKSDTKAIQHYYETNDRTVAKKKVYATGQIRTGVST
jgi:hypothetical protein